MIIWGSRVRYKDLGEGEFFCPRCQDKRPYKHKKATRYFTLYFIPLIPMGQLGELVECQICKTAYETSVLQLRAGPPRDTKTSDAAALMKAIASRVRGGDPLEYVVRDLTAAGIDLDVARGAVNGAARSPIRKCSTCGLTYGSTISQCQSCGRSLV
jgi:zinc-ribbon family